MRGGEVSDTLNDLDGLSEQGDQDTEEVSAECGGSGCQVLVKFGKYFYIKDDIK